MPQWYDPLSETIWYLESAYDKVEKERNYCAEVDQVHRLLEKPKLSRGADEPLILCHKKFGNFEKKRLNRFEDGQKNLMQYSMRKKRTAPFSEMLHILILAVATLGGDECGSNLQRPWPERPPGKVGVALSPPLSGTLQRSSHSEG